MERIRLFQTTHGLDELGSEKDALGDDQYGFQKVMYCLYVQGASFIGRLACVLSEA